MRSLNENFESWIIGLAAMEQSESRKEPEYWNDEKIRVVLLKIGERHRRKPFDTKQLAQDLESATRQYEIWQFFDQRPTDRQAGGRAKEIQNLSRRLLGALPRPGDSDVFGHLLFPTADKLDELYAAIACLEEIEKLAARVTNLSSKPSKRNTANQWLIGREIPKIHERYFTSKPRGVSYSSGREKPGGPAIEFCLNVLKIMNVKNHQGRPYRPGGIVEIWKRL